MMQLVDSGIYKRDTPASVADFMNYIDRPAKVERTAEQNYELIDQEIFGV